MDDDSLHEIDECCARCKSATELDTNQMLFHCEDEEGYHGIVNGTQLCDDFKCREDD